MPSASRDARDATVRPASSAFLGTFDKRIHFYHGNTENTCAIACNEEIKGVNHGDGIAEKVDFA